MIGDVEVWFESAKPDTFLNKRAETMRTLKQIDAQMKTDRNSHKQSLQDAEAFKAMRKGFADDLKRLDEEIANYEMKQAGASKPDGPLERFWNGFMRAVGPAFTPVDGGAAADHADWHSLAQEKSELEAQVKTYGKGQAPKELQVQLEQTNRRIAELAEKRLMTTGYCELGKP